MPVPMHLHGPPLFPLDSHEYIPVHIAALAKAKQEALNYLPAEYYQPEYDSVAGELALLPRMFTEADLEHVVEERSGVLEVQPIFCTNPLTKIWQALA